MDTLNPRQKEILARTIEAHIETALPVGSRTLAEHYRIQLSPASLRHEMGLLEELGYLTHPHTSAGRLPTDKGYHFYVKEVVREETVPEEILRQIASEMQSKIENLDDLMNRVSRILSAVAGEAVLVTTPRLQELCLRELSLFTFDPKHLLAVWCSTSGLVQNCLIELEAPLSQEEADRIRNFINRELGGTPVDQLEKELLKRIESCRDSLKDVYELTLEIIRESLPAESLPRLFVEGSRFILDQPEFRDVKKFQLLMATLEERSALVKLLMKRATHAEIHVAIGEKELSKEIWDCALVSRSYHWLGKNVGTLAILGPRRMPYGRIMGLVHEMTESISQTLAKWGS